MERKKYVYGTHSHREYQYKKHSSNTSGWFKYLVAVCMTGQLQVKPWADSFDIHLLDRVLKVLHINSIDAAREDGSV